MAEHERRRRRKSIPYVGLVGAALIVASILAAIKGWQSSPVIEQAEATAPEYHAPVVSVPMPAATVYSPPSDLPPIELQSLPAMQERLNDLIHQHNASRAARWNAINQGNLRAAALIECYRSERSDCE